MPTVVMDRPAWRAERGLDVAAYRRAAVGGSVEAMANLGALYLDRMEPPNVDAARYWLEPGARAGNIGAMVRLGFLCMEHLGEFDTARLWLTSAAQAGDAYAMHNLGILYSRSDPPDFDAAREWFTRAVGSGNVVSAIVLRNLERYQPV
ncbi:Sel1 repeat [Mycolicibacterium phlei]|jgi:TPR repeat protein|nr:SEL1-like repeat protein [Mycolicibacterium phlei]AMO62000.1 Sel1 repeat protein [Mycolicibacterium phlei]STZ19739.1 Sel1 repeat [Mycolicibacterium phlei]VEG10105.1 Sel1 repeat [Mycobacteroides chelonae]